MVWKEKNDSHDNNKDHAISEDSHELNSHSLEEASHDEHLLHQLQNRPWAALYVAALFFMLLALGTLAFYAIQRAAQAGWSPILFRVMEGINSLPSSRNSNYFNNINSVVYAFKSFICLDGS